MKNNLNKIIKVMAIAIMALFLVSCKKNKVENKGPYKIEYVSKGSGFIKGDVATGEMVEKDTMIHLEANIIGDNQFIAWFIKDKEYSKSKTLNIIITTDLSLEARFTGKKIDTSKKTKIKDLEGDVEFTGTVIAINNGMSVIQDNTGSVIIDKDNFELNDTVLVKGQYQKDSKTVITKNIQIIGTTPIIEYERFGNFELNSYIDLNKFGKTVYFEGVYNDGNINTTFSSIKIKVSNPDKLKKIVGYKVKFKGVLTHSNVISSSNKEISFICNEYEIIQAEDNKLIAYFPDSWQDVRIINDGIEIAMIRRNDRWETDSLGILKNIRFKNSNNEKTKRFEFDSETPVFILREKKFNGDYTGYFTTSDSIENTVLKINILEFNDLHGYVLQNEEGKGGLSNASYIVNQIRDEDPADEVLLAANGDIFQGTAISNLSKGKSVIGMMNQMNFDFMGIGNHEFDWGIEEVLKYFDGNKSNGEANFPLINSNIRYVKDNKLLISEGGNMFETYSVKKNGIDIGIISCIGNVYKSINYAFVKDYKFDTATNVVEELGKKLKDEGNEIIIVNTHGGNIGDISQYTPNQNFASLRYKGEPLIDAVINGHTHQVQFGDVERDGADLPIVQSGCNCRQLGEIELYYDIKQGKVVSNSFASYPISLAGTKYDPKVEKVVQDEVLSKKAQLEEVYAVAGESVSSRRDLYEWTANVLCAGVGADIGISNKGGIRSTGNIITGENIGLENMYMINPFDNYIMLLEMKGKDIYSFMNSSSVYYGLKPGLSKSDIQNSNKTYKVAVIDYVYYWSSFPKEHPTTNTKKILRNLLIEDLKLKTKFYPITHPEADITN